MADDDDDGDCYDDLELTVDHGAPNTAQTGGETESNPLFFAAGGATVGRDCLQQARVHQIHPEQQGQREVRCQTTATTYYHPPPVFFSSSGVPCAVAVHCWPLRQICTRVPNACHPRGKVLGHCSHVFSNSLDTLS